MEKKSLPWNLLQANAILERMHQVLQDCLVTFELENVDIPEEGDKLHPFAEYLSNAAYGIRCAFHATNGHSPGGLVFGGSCHCKNIMHTKRPNQNIMYTLRHSQYKQNWLL